MKKILATIIKEWLLMRRDIAGLLLLFLMPAILIVVMALVQDAPFKDYQEMRFDLLLVNNDNGFFASQIKSGLRQSRNFTVIDSIDDQPLTEVGLKKLLQNGKYKIGIVIPKGVTPEIVNSANILANNISQKIGLGATQPVRAIRENVYISMYFDPVSPPSFRTAINFALDKYITYACSDVMLQRLSALSKTSGDATPNDTQDFKKILQGIRIREEPLNDTWKYKQNVNTVQHNVPAWAIFGIFFIVIAISGHMIREREDGSAFRIGMIPGAQKYVAAGKILFYTIICAIQFALMCAIGTWVLPLLGLPALYFGIHPWLLVPIALTISFCATSYGYLVGSVFRTTNQALPFGAISIVIFAAMGGIWVPIELLSSGMKTIALASPLHWSLEAVHSIIIRNGGVHDIIFPLSMLLLIGIVNLLLSVLINSRRYLTAN